MVINYFNYVNCFKYVLIDVKNLWKMKIQISKSSSAARCTGRQLVKACVTLVFQLNFKVIISCRMHWTSACLSMCHFGISAKFQNHHITKLLSSASCSWWWICYMQKQTWGQVLVLPGHCLVHPVANNDFENPNNLCISSVRVCLSLISTVCNNVKYEIIKNQYEKRWSVDELETL